MTDFKMLNKVMGWVMFVIALVVYTLTLEPSVSLWDCGEFASAAYKLQVVHPPGAPFFLMIGRLFSLMAGSPEKVGFWINMLSATSSAGCVMFTFWITTHFAQKLVSEATENRTILILGAGVVAALTNTFLDTFWFSAVEAEVYALSSFFTALTFWAILRWERAADTPGADRWIVFIAFMIGLALGTHMLNLLVIPTICLAYYFHRHKISTSGFMLALGAAALALGFVMKVIYPGIPWLLANMDKLFVNGFGLPFYSGAIFAIILIIGSLAFLAYFTHKRNAHNLNLIVMSVFFVIFGYSSYTMVVVRSLANPAIDMNDPDDPYKFYGYITREQYGERPLLKGPYFNAPQVDYELKGKKYFKGDKQYEEGGENYEPIYDEEYNTLFPRMGKSNKPGDAKGFREYGGMGDIQMQIENMRNSGKPLSAAEKQTLDELEYEKPSFGNNLTYFFNYQIRYMYIRYFFWNFVGRFNDQQAVSGNSRFDGNWYSGIPFIDSYNIGPKQGMPDYWKNQKGRNAYYFLPLLLGILGLIWQLKGSRKDFWLVMTLFLFTGILIIVYMNQPPYEPRERDYAHVGSFQTFCIWVGLGVLALADLLQKYLKKSAPVVAAGASLLLVPVNMGYQNWDDHDRSGRYIGIDMAKNFLNSLGYNAVLLCNGDNDTYPLWYAQNVEGIRTDVRIINESLLPTEWYSSVLLNKVYKSDPLPLTVTRRDLQTGSFEYGIEIDRQGYKARRPLRKTIQELLADNRARGGQGITWHGGLQYIKVDKEAVKKAGVVSPKDYRYIVDSIELDIGGTYLSKGDLVVYDLIATNAERGWTRPIYFTSVSGYDFNFLNKYLQHEGLVYRFVPIKGGVESRNEPHKLADFQMYNNLVHRYRYYGMNKKKNFFLDDKAAYVPNDMQQMALGLANYYLMESEQFDMVKKSLDSGRTIPAPPGFASINEYVDVMKDSIPLYKKRGIELLNHMMKEIPESVMPMRRDLKTEFAITLISLGDLENGKKLLDAAMKDNQQFAKYFNRWKDETWMEESQRSGVPINNIFAYREVSNSQYFMDRVLKFCAQKGHKDWETQYKQMTTGIL
ncbi:MAG: DUF2723 domain-containing protein [Bacteroidetes bacterium]|nr:DUF2723 domain-containing protein [Bacteroidota bacterium]